MAFETGLAAVEACRATKSALAGNAPQRDDVVVAVGKAAEAMLRGAAASAPRGFARGLLIVPPRYRSTESLPPAVCWLPGGHPRPDIHSLAAGEALRDTLAGLASPARVFFLLSGGASAMLELPMPGVTLADLERANDWLLSSGLPIRKVNAVRARLSQFKAGGLLRFLPPDCRAEVLLISDVPGDDPAVIGSGPLCAGRHDLPDDLPDWLSRLIERIPLPRIPERAIPHRVIASNTACRQAVARFARSKGLSAFDHGETLTGDAAECGASLARQLRAAEPGLHIWGGETGVVLPAAPGRGGRNQHLALAAALELRDCDDIWLLAAGTDGVDGNTDDAGAQIDGGTCRRGAEAGFEARDCLARADAGSFLEAAGDLVNTGPTGTNVMDLVVALKA